MSTKKALEVTSIKSNILRLIIWLQLFSLVLNLPLTQFQMMFFGRKIIGLNHLGFIECVLIAIVVLMSKEIYINKITKYTMVLVGTLLFIGLIGIMINEVQIYWIMYYFVYWIIPFFIIILSNQIRFDINKLSKGLLLIIVVHCTIIFIQRFTNDILWPFTNDEYGNQIFFISEGYYNTTDIMARCPGISISGLDAGLLLIFGCVLLKYMEFKHKFTKYILGIFFLVGIWYTGTRNIYILVIYMFVFALITKFTPRKLRAIFCNVYMILCSIMYTSLFFTIGNNYSYSTKNILTDTLSAKIRIENWSGIVDIIEEGNILQKVFGQFKWQNNMGNIVIDNVFLEIILFCGIVGLIGFCLYIILIQIQLIKMADEKCVLLIAFISALMIYGVANVLGNIYISLIVVSILIFNNSMNDEVRANK